MYPALGSYGVVTVLKGTALVWLLRLCRHGVSAWQMVAERNEAWMVSKSFSMGACGQGKNAGLCGVGCRSTCGVTAQTHIPEDVACSGVCHILLLTIVTQWTSGPEWR